MKNTNQNSIVVQNYFNAFEKGAILYILDSFHPDCKIISVRDGQREKHQLHGTYKGKENAKQFLENIFNHFETKLFTVEKIIAEENLVFAYGQFLHKVKATGKIFNSAWVQRCIIEDGKIKEYQFYEDSAAFINANE